MENTAKKPNNSLRIEGKPQKLSWNEITKAANKLATSDPILSKREKKFSASLTFFQKNIHWRNKALFSSYLCALISLFGSSLGVYSFIEPSNTMSYLIAFVLGCLILVNEYGFRYFVDQYGDELFIFRNKLNSHLPKFLFFSLVTILITSGGFYKWNIENHAPDPALLAIKAEIKQKKIALIPEQAAYDLFVKQSTVKSGPDKGRVQYNLEGSINKAKLNLEDLKTTIANLENDIRGKKVLNPNYQTDVLRNSIAGAFILMLFAFFYIGCMLYMSYFDNRHYGETYPSKYLSYVAKRNAEKENFQ